jgi:hypothetical protein
MELSKKEMSFPNVSIGLPAAHKAVLEAGGESIPCLPASLGQMSQANKPRVGKPSLRDMTMYF